jgi:lysophospholipase L1-like esterase
VRGLVTGIALAVFMLAMPAAQASTTSGHRRSGVRPDYYLALGDSLSVGMQPTTAGFDVLTGAAYPNQFYRMVRNGHYYPGLRLAQLGCPDETTATILHGGICGYSGDQRASLIAASGSQAAAALAFIAAHRGHVPLITLDIGANDLDPCIATGTISGIQACLPGALAVIMANLATLLAQLRTADPAAVILGMTYYDPYLAEWLTGSAGQTFATASVSLAAVFNDALDNVYADYLVPVADVAAAFDTSDMTGQVTLPLIGTVPQDVAKICTLTWECAPLPQGQDEHCNAVGYRVIARAFYAAFPPRTPLPRLVALNPASRADR